MVVYLAAQQLRRRCGPQERPGAVSRRQGDQGRAHVSNDGAGGRDRTDSWGFPQFCGILRNFTEFWILWEFYGILLGFYGILMGFYRFLYMGVPR